MGESLTKHTTVAGWIMTIPHKIVYVHGSYRKLRNFITAQVLIDHDVQISQIASYHQF